MDMACGNNPSRLKTDADGSALFAFFGQVYDRLLSIVFLV
jgi:hypothetical protein